jgi:ABC-type sugar transport system, periplasmic component
MKKKLLAVLLSVAMVATMLTACGSKAPATEEPTTEAPAEEPAAEEPAAEPAAEEPAAGGDNLEASKVMFADAVDAEMTTDNQILMPEPILKEVPERPADPESLPDDDAGKYFDMEYLTEGEKAENLPASPADGSIGKKVVVIVHGDHAWTTAYSKGYTQAGEALGMEIEVLSPNWDQAMQDQLIDQAINSKPDAIALIPLSAENATQQFKKITDAGIPAFGTNTLATADALAYMQAWTGPDDWAQMRQLADTLGTAMEGKGGVAYITHNVGTSPYYARTYGPITQLKATNPEIQTLDIQSPGFEAAKVKQVVSDWCTKYGDELNAIFLADDSDQVTGTVDALKEANRTDVLVVAAGNSKAGQDAVKAGDVKIINYQSAEGDAGLSARTVAAWFNGEEIHRVGYLTTDMITQENVDQFFPTQW